MNNKRDKGRNLGILWDRLRDNKVPWKDVASRHGISITRAQQVAYSEARRLGLCQCAVAPMSEYHSPDCPRRR
jgi:hypothetical protein